MKFPNEKKIRSIYIKNKYKIKLFRIFFIIVNIAYFPAYFAYFQQDEWFFFAYLNKYIHSPFGFIQSLIVPFTDPKAFAFHITPLFPGFIWLELKFFAFHYLLYIFFSLLLHTINTILIVLLVEKLSSSRFIAIMSGIFFAVTASHYEAVTWINTHINSETSLLFALLSIFFFLSFLQKYKRKFMFWTIIFYIFSLLTKEIAVFIVFLYPVLALLLKPAKNIGKIKNFFILLSSVLVIRSLLPSLLTRLTGGEVISGLSEKNKDLMFTAFYTISLFLKGLAQSFLSGLDFARLAEKVTDVAYPQYTLQKSIRGLEYLTFTQSAALDIVMHLLGFLIVLCIAALFFSLFIYKKQYLKLFIISVAIVVTSIMPFILLSGWLVNLFTYISNIDARHLYMTSVGSGILFGIFLFLFKDFIRNISIRLIRRDISLTIIGILVIFWSVWQIITIYANIAKYNTYANDRKNIIDAWLDERTELTKQNIFYAESNVALFGFAEYMLPFQHNPGQVIMSIYGYQQRLPEGFLTVNSLAKPITKEWLEEHDGMQIGYYLKKKHLLQDTVSKNFDPDNIIAVKYDGTLHFVQNISSVIQYEVKDFLDKRKKIAGWKKFSDFHTGITLFYPESLAISVDKGQNKLIEITLSKPSSGTDILRIRVYSKPDNMGISDFVNLQTDKTDITLDRDYTIERFTAGPYATDSYTAVTTRNNAEKSYYFNTIMNSQVKQVTIPDEVFLSDDEKSSLKTILEFMEFNN